MKFARELVCRVEVFCAVSPSIVQCGGDLVADFAAAMVTTTETVPS